MRIPYISLLAAGALSLGGCAYDGYGMGMGSPYYSYGYGSTYGTGYGYSPYGYSSYGYTSPYYGSAYGYSPYGYDYGGYGGRGGVSISIGGGSYSPYSRYGYYPGYSSWPRK